MTEPVYADIKFYIDSEYTPEQLQPIIDEVGQTFIDEIMCNPDKLDIHSTQEEITTAIIEMIDGFVAKGYHRSVVEQIMQQITVFVVTNQALLLHTEENPTIN